MRRLALLALLCIGGCARCPQTYRIAHVVWNRDSTITLIGHVDTKWGHIVRVDTLPGVWRPQ